MGTCQVKKSLSPRLSAFTDKHSPTKPGDPETDPDGDAYWAAYGKNLEEAGKRKRALTDAQGKQEADAVETAADRTAQARLTAQRAELDQLRQHASALETAAQAAAKTAQEAWDLLLNPETASEKRAAHDAERKEGKLERRLATAREKQGKGLHLTNRSKALIDADDQRQAAADLQIRASAEMDHFQADRAALAIPSMPGAPASGGVDIASLLQEISTHTAKMAEGGVIF
jgi:hypothetical protein